jgi:nucleoside-diphosphate-sugar epimerase
VDFNGVHKFAATSYHLMLTRAGYLDAAVLRLTNVYGPRMALDAVCQGFLSTFLRRMVLGQQIEIFGDGSQARDPLYIDDAVNAFLLLGAVQQPVSRCYNAGGPNALSLAAIAHTASAIGGCPAPVFTPFPPDRSELRHYIDPAEPDPPCRMHEHSGGPYHLTYVKVAEGAG